MNSMAISYNRINAQAADSWSRKKIICTLLSSALVVTAVICAAAGTTRDDEDGGGDSRTTYLRRWKSTSSAVRDACSSTRYPEFCVSTVGNLPELYNEAGPMHVVNGTVRLGMEAVQEVRAHAQSMSTRALDFRQKTVLNDCMELFNNTLDELKDMLSYMQNVTFMSMPRHAADMETLLSAAITNQDTCLDGFQLCKGNLKHNFQGGVRNVSQLVSISLAMVRNISDKATRAVSSANRQSTHNRRLLSDSLSVNNGFPTWMSTGDRRLLQAPGGKITFNAVVAKDGSGDYTKISAAVAAAPDMSKTRYVIYIKAGIYQENVDINKHKINLMFIGDGKDVTVVTGNRNVKDGYTTFRSATVAVTGKAFIARDITFENTAGPSKYQAVALRVSSDLSALYRCSFKGYQDTLYVHSLRQFYRECDVHGTIDFIFGNAAVVLQNCNLLARKPMEKQKIAYTAQGRQDPNQNTGISIQNCNVAADSDLAPVKGSFQAYLGRPYKEYSRTVFMLSYLDDLINPAGWLEWNGNFALNTLYYGEYINHGPGAGTANRVKWPGYHVIDSSTEASQFTVARFIEGDSWLPLAGVMYDAGLP